MVMKRRNRKRKSKAGSPAPGKIPGDAEKAAGPSAALGPSTALAGADGQTDAGDEFIAPVEVKTPGSDPTALVETDYVIDLSDEFIATAEEEKSASDSVTLGPSTALAGAGADRRTHPRYEFMAAVEVVAAESGARIETRVRDLSQQGCYVDTSDALPLGTVTGVRITKGAQLFEARARVVYSRAGKGMGLMFTAIDPAQLRTLETGIAESRETSRIRPTSLRRQRVLIT